MLAEALGAGLARAQRRCFLHVDDLGGWKIKTYGIAAGRRPRAELVAAAVRVATGTLPARPDLDGAFGLGFLVIHDTAGGAADTVGGCCLALVHWWVRPDELHQRVFAAAPDAPRSLVPQDTGTIGHLAELAIIEHERQALLRHVLDRPSGPDVDAYLIDVLH